MYSIIVHFHRLSFTLLWLVGPAREFSPSAGRKPAVEENAAKQRAGAADLMHSSGTG
jgi:hypothetical protein